MLDDAESRHRSAEYVSRTMFVSLFHYDVLFPVEWVCFIINDYPGSRRLVGFFERVRREDNVSPFEAVGRRL
ncbi:hypothetical protein JCM18750_40750 [Halostagnicola bangensis]